MGYMHVMGRSGHDTMRWEPEVEEEVSAAEALFNANLARGWAAFSVAPETRETERLEVFKPEADRIVFVPPMSGG